MSRAKINLGLTYKEALVVKHALRDKADKDQAEENLLAWVTDEIEIFRERNKIVPRSVRNERNTNQSY